MFARLVLAVASVAAVLSLTACGRVDLSFEPNTNDTRTYHITNDFKTQWGGGGFNVSQGMQGGLDLAFQASGKEADNATVKATFGSSDLKVDMNVGMPGMDMSALMGQANAATSKALDNLEGKSFTAYVAPKAGVARLDGLAELDAAVRSKLEQEQPPGMPPMMQPGNAFGESTLRRWLAPVFPAFPEKIIKVGETWTDTKAYTDDAPRIEERTYTFTELKEGVATLTYTLAIRPNPDAPAQQIPMGSGKLDLTGSGSGTMKVERRTGWIVQSEETLSATGPMTLQSRLLPGGMSFTVNLNSHMTVTAK